MKIEIPTGYRTGEIAYCAGILVDELTKTQIPGTEFWPYLRTEWINHIKGIRGRRDLKANGLSVGYRGYLDNIGQMAEFRGLSLILEDPRILVHADEDILSPLQFLQVDDIVHEVSSQYNLDHELPPKTLIFSKEAYAKEIVVFDSHDLNIH